MRLRADPASGELARKGITPMFRNCRIQATSIGTRIRLPFWMLTVVLALVGISAIGLTADDDPTPPTIPEPAVEEFDIFRERAKQLARQERREERQSKKKKKKSSIFGNSFALRNAAPEDTSDGYGMMGRGGHLIGKTFGRDTSLSPLEVMPYMLSDEHFIFADVRGFLTNRSRAGGNAGLGYRYLRDDLNAWGGASIWYDGDQSTEKYFQQVGLSFEALISRFEMRSNVYIPFSSTQIISEATSNGSIVGNQLLFGRSIDKGVALRGVDYEAGFSIPVMERHAVRGFLGGYHFEGGPSGGINGFKARIEGVYNNGPSLQLLYTSDKLYGDNLMVGIELQLPWGNRHPTAGWKRNTPSPFRYVERNYNVIVDHDRQDLGDQVAINPLTGRPYVVDQVYVEPPGTAHQPIVSSGGPPVPDGTAENPYHTIADAQAAGADIIIVRSGSVISDTITLAPGQHLLGQGNYSSVIPVLGGGSVTIADVLQASGPGSSTQTPIFQGVTGTAVVLNSNTELAGFVFTSSTGTAVTGTNVNGASIHDLTFTSTGGDAIHLTNSSGLISMKNIQINAATGNGIVFDGGNADITFDGAGRTITTLGDGFVLSNLTGGDININNLSLKNTGGAGLRMTNVDTDVTIASLSTLGTTGPAVAISGNTGQLQTVDGVTTTVYNTYDFTGNTTILSPNGAGFTVNGTDAIVNVTSLNVQSTAGAPAVSLVNNAGSTMTFGNMTLNTNGGKALYAVGLKGLVINGGSITSAGAAAVDIGSSTINTTFSSIAVNGGPVGISLVQSTGAFIVSGNGVSGSGGTIYNTTNGLLIDTFGNISLSMMNFTNNGTAIQSTKSSQLTLAGLQIQGSTGYAIDSHSDSVLILNNSTLASNGALGGGTIRIQGESLGTFQSLISGNTITDNNGTAIQYLTNAGGAGASLATTVQSNTINGSFGGGSLVDINWNGPGSVLVANNAMNLYGASMFGVRAVDTSTTQILNMQASGNTMTFMQGASSGTGIYVNTASTSQLNIAQNSIDFKATSGIGLRFSLGGTSTDYIGSNLITDEAGGATGMLFDTVAANTRLQIDGNTINLLSGDLTTHRGIIFTQVTPTIQFSGTVNNLIYNVTSAQDMFSIPVNSSTGGFYINGSLY